MHEFQLCKSQFHPIVRSMGHLTHTRYYPYIDTDFRLLHKHYTPTHTHTPIHTNTNNRATTNFVHEHQMSNYEPKSINKLIILIAFPTHSLQSILKSKRELNREYQNHVDVLFIDGVFWFDEVFSIKSIYYFHVFTGKLPR